MRTQIIYYKCIGVVIHVVMLVMLFACGKPLKDKEKSKSQNTRTEMEEELENLSNSSTKLEKHLHVKTKSLVIRIKPVKVLNPIEAFDRVNLPNCGGGSWDENRVTYNKSKVIWNDSISSFANFVRTSMHLKITSPKGTFVTGRIDQFLNSGSAVIHDRSNIIEIIFPNKTTPNFFNGKDELDIELVLYPENKIIDIGRMKEVSRSCIRTPHDPTRGADGATRGGMIEIKEKDMTSSHYSDGLGFAPQTFEVQYDLDIRIISKFKE